MNQPDRQLRKPTTPPPHVQIITPPTQRIIVRPPTPPPVQIVTQPIQPIIITMQPPLRWHPGLAAVLSLILPGLGQLYKGQPLNGLVWFLLTAAGYVCFIIPGVVLHLCCVLGAGMGDPTR